MEEGVEEEHEAGQEGKDPHEAGCSGAENTTTREPLTRGESKVGLLVLGRWAGVAGVGIREGALQRAGRQAGKRRSVIGKGESGEKKMMMMKKDILPGKGRETWKESEKKSRKKGWRMRGAMVIASTTMLPPRHLFAKHVVGPGKVQVQTGSTIDRCLHWTSRGVAFATGISSGPASQRPMWRRP